MWLILEHGASPLKCPVFFQPVSCSCHSLFINKRGPSDWCSCYETRALKQQSVSARIRRQASGGENRASRGCAACRIAMGLHASPLGLCSMLNKPTVSTNHSRPPYHFRSSGQHLETCQRHS